MLSLSVAVFVCERELTYMLHVVIVGGAGGKGTWGKMTEVYDEDGCVKDARDPNYDSDESEVS